MATASFNACVQILFNKKQGWEGTLDLSIWLQGLGLEHYESLFRQQEIDLDILPELGEQDLKSLGLPLGPRKKLLRALAQQDGIATAQSRSAPSQEDEDGPSQGTRAERRQITVMFCDLVGSSSLAARLDPEEMRQVIRQYHKACAQVIKRWDGHIASYMGDGIMVYFGWPRVHEDDGERAVRAALEIISGGLMLYPDMTEKLSCRIGIATGLVVVGDTSDETWEEAAFGETPNLAARLQSLAHPDTVVISPHTRRLLGGLFELADLGLHELKGFSQNLHIWEVAGESDVRSRFEAMHGYQPTPLVGRTSEMELLLNRLALAKNGEGQVVLLTGPPGIGKSRLIGALVERLGQEKFHRLQYHCSPYHTNSALHPVIESLKHAAGMTSEEPEELKLQRLEEMVQKTHADSAQVVPLLASLLAVPFAPPYSSLELSADAKKARIFEFLFEQIAGLSKSCPVIMVLEDSHWLDPTSAEFFSQIADRLQHLPVLLLATSRSHEPAQIGSHAHLTSISLTRLSRKEVVTMIRRVSGERQLPQEVIQHILVKTDGIPFFIEELTKMLLEMNYPQHREEGQNAAYQADLLSIPSTLQDLLMARLDRDPVVKELAQIGAVIGREFTYDLIAQLAPYQEPVLLDITQQLMDSDLVITRGTPPEASFRFKHAFIQDTAYKSLLRSRRQQLHARLADILLEDFPELVAEQPELVAQHFTEGKRTREALLYWKKAGLLASERSSASEAAAHFQNALDCLADLPESEPRDHEELELLTLLGSSLISTQGAGAKTVATAHEKAAELARKLGVRTAAVPIFQGLRLHFQERADLKTASEMANRLMETVSDQCAPRHQLEAYRASAVVAYFAGDFVQAHDLVSRGLDNYANQAAQDLGPCYENDACMTCAAYRGRALLQLGYLDQAVDWTRHAQIYAENAAHTMSYVEAMTWRAEVAFERGDYSKACEFADSALQTATRYGLPLWAGLAVVLGGSARFSLGERNAGITQIREGIARLDGKNQKLLMLHSQILLLKALAEDGRTTEGLELAERIESELEGTAVGHLDANLRRLQGELYLAQQNEPLETAENLLRDSMTVAGHQQARLLELRAANRLANLWIRQGRFRQAQQLLQPLHDWFTEGGETEDVKRAAAYLSKLS
ncbi:adenylate/guanylate cyclase domain-containing protein [Fodinicurvata sediminis]|uniref:adenylate/guanylate cyclase domain-containing protein n=1 Tax=Fodinicurvata sediminis TaxID=1121832 RepID=UPI0003B3E779|nr:adenylate/guanylate cyclase domain-containing protein [Fodinicurvata sediminis]